jgi:hypothetical protein
LIGFSRLLRVNIEVAQIPTQIQDFGKKNIHKSNRSIKMKIIVLTLALIFISNFNFGTPQAFTKGNVKGQDE